MDPTEERREAAEKRAAEVLGTKEKADLWLEAPNRALGGATPLSQLHTGAGADAVEAVLTRIEHGIFS